MASKNNIYVITMYRWGIQDTHSYVLGAFTKKQAAMNAADDERIRRGGTKYIPEIVEFAPNSTNPKIIVARYKSPALGE